MFNRFRKQQYTTYAKAKRHFIADYQHLIGLEQLFMDVLYQVISNRLTEIVADYNEASYLYPFWQNYPPLDRGRQPKGDQFPWIEVGEHVIGSKLPRFLDEEFTIRDVGLPSGPDQRFVITDTRIKDVTQGFTNSCFLFIDIKSVGPRDDADHAVMSHNQISGKGHWNKIGEGIRNAVMTAKGKRSTHSFFCGIPPIYVLSDNTILPVIFYVIKPVYKMLSLSKEYEDGGQPLDRLTLVSIPNGLLLEEKPGYLRKHPSLFFPGKDDKGKNP